MFSTSLWQTFVESLSGPVEAIVKAEPMLAKVNFPRKAIILAKVGEVLFNFAIKLILIVGMFIYFQIAVPATALSSFLGVLYQDVQQGLTMVTGFCLFLTPGVDSVPETGTLSWLVRLNPVTPLLVTARELATTGTVTQPVAFWIVNLLTLIGLLLTWIIFPHCPALRHRKRELMIVSSSGVSTTASESSTDWVINVEGISKKFCRDLRRSLFYGVRDVATDLLGGKRGSDRLRRGEFWALKDISFQIGRGEAVGLVGANGAGKSTLLRIISGLIKPDSGCVRVRGRLAPLIALGAGFNPILTGRENIYANMSILGLSTREIQQRFDEVVEFAGISEAIDAPVQTYSSGMAARLGFACAIHVEPEILLIDEVLAVGDMDFRMKCFKRLAQLREQGTAFILVSHNPYSILNVCQSAIYLTRGRLMMQGEAVDIIARYEEDLCLGGTTEDEARKSSCPPKSEAESLGLDILSVAFEDENGNLLKDLEMGQPAWLGVECLGRQAIENVNMVVVIRSLTKEADRILLASSYNDGVCLSVRPGKIKFYWKMPFCGLVPGKYTLRIFLREGVRCFDVLESFRFIVKANEPTSHCIYYQPRIWEAIEFS